MTDKIIPLDNRYEELLGQYQTLEESFIRRNEEFARLTHRVEEAEAAVKPLKEEMEGLQTVIDQKVVEINTLSQNLTQTQMMAERYFLMLENFSKGVAK